MTPSLVSGHLDQCCQVNVFELLPRFRMHSTDPDDLTRGLSGLTGRTDSMVTRPADCLARCANGNDSHANFWKEDLQVAKKKAAAAKKAVKKAPAKKAAKKAPAKKAAKKAAKKKAAPAAP